MFPGTRALQVRDFRNLWIAQTVSQFGDSVYWLVFLFMADRISQRPEIVGLVGAAQALPFLLFSPLAGVAADRFDRRKLMAFGEFGSAAILATLAVIVWFDPMPSVWIIGTAAFLLSSLNSIFIPARGAALPRLVPKHLVMEANALAMATQQTMGVLGIALSASALGAIYKVTPDYFFLAAIVINGITFLVSGSYLLRLPSIVPTAEERGHEAPHMMRDLREGLRVMMKDALLRVALPLNLLVNLFISGFMVIYVTVNRTWFDGDYTTLAVIEFGFAATMALTSLVAGRFKIVRPGLAYVWAMVAVAIPVGLMAWGQNYAFFVFLNLVCGFAVPFAMLPMATYIGVEVKDEYRGRVNSVMAMTSVGIQPIGLALAGPMLAVLGPSGMFLFMGIGMAAACAAAALNPGFRNARMNPYEPASPSEATPG